MPQRVFFFSVSMQNALRGNQQKATESCLCGPCATSRSYIKNSTSFRYRHHPDHRYLFIIPFEVRSASEKRRIKHTIYAPLANRRSNELGPMLLGE